MMWKNRGLAIGRYSVLAIIIMQETFLHNSYILKSDRKIKVAVFECSCSSYPTGWPIHSIGYVFKCMQLAIIAIHSSSVHDTMYQLYVASYSCLILLNEIYSYYIAM